MNHTCVYNNCMVSTNTYRVFVLTIQLLYTQVWFMHYHVFVLTIQLLHTQVWFMDYRVFVTCVYINCMVNTIT
jgi:hypothetical protein